MSHGNTPLDLSNSATTAANWRRFEKSWIHYEIATGLLEKPDQVRLATLLHVIGIAGNEKYETFTFDSDEDRDNIEVVMTKFRNECEKKTNELN